MIEQELMFLALFDYMFPDINKTSINFILIIISILIECIHLGDLYQIYSILFFILQVLNFYACFVYVIKMSIFHLILRETMFSHNLINSTLLNLT